MGSRHGEYTQISSKTAFSCIFSIDFNNALFFAFF